MDKLISAIETYRMQKSTTDSLIEDGPNALDKAYRIQTTIASRKAEAGDAVVGYKLGLLSPDKQRQMGVSEPIIGHVHESMVINPGEVIRRERFIQPRVEPELAVVFEREVPAGSRRGELIAAIAYVLLVVDVLDSIWKDYKFTAADVIADNASGGGIVVGRQRLPADVLWNGDDALLRMSVGGGPWHTGALSSLGDPLVWLGWAADRAAGLGRGIQPGDMLLLGAPCAAVRLPATDGNGQPLTVEGPAGAALVAQVQ